MRNTLGSGWDLAVVGMGWWWKTLFLVLIRSKHGAKGKDRLLNFVCAFA